MTPTAGEAGSRTRRYPVAQPQRVARVGVVLLRARQFGRADSRVVFRHMGRRI